MAKTWRVALLAGLAGLWVTFGGYALWRIWTGSLTLQSEPSGGPEEEFRTVRLMRPHEPITLVPTKPVREAWDAFNPAELVLGVTVGGEARAYPLNVLNDAPGQKVLNDFLGGQAVAATF